MQQIRKHFLSPGRNEFLNDVSITFIDKTDLSDPLKREDYWRRTLKIIAPSRLNVEDSCFIWHLDHDIDLDYFKDYDFWIMDIFI